MSQNINISTKLEPGKHYHPVVDSNGKRFFVNSPEFDKAKNDYDTVVKKFGQERVNEIVDDINN
jgi:hypothetical protein